MFFYRAALVVATDCSGWCNSVSNLTGTSLVKENYLDFTGFELMYGDSGNTMHCSFFTIQFFPPTQKITMPRKVSVSYKYKILKKKIFLAVQFKNNFNMMRISFLLRQLCWCCLDIKLFSLILFEVSFCNSFQLYVLFLSMHWYTEDCFKIDKRCFKSVYY